MSNMRDRKPLIGLSALLVIGIGVGMWYLVHHSKNLKQAFADYIATNPDSASVAVYTFDQDGEYIEDGSAIFHNADQPYILASTMKLAVLTAYADAVANGSLDPQEQVPIKDWEMYYLPMTDGGSHRLGLKSLGLKVDELGFAHDQGATAPLHDLARIMIHYSGNAATDYLIARIGTEKIYQVMVKAGLGLHSPIRATLGTILAIFSHENQQSDIDQLLSISQDMGDGYAAYLDHLMEQYLNDPSWRKAQIQHMLDYYQTTNLSEQEIWAFQAAASHLFPKGTAREYAALMAKAASGTLISAEVSEIMREYLESVPSDWPIRLLYDERFGAKDGVTAGVLTIASYAVPKRGTFAGQYRVVVLLVNEMPFDDWVNQLEFEGHYLLQTDLAKGLGIFGELRNLEQRNTGETSPP